ncbi:MAG TPA: hypothetical protein VIK91_02135, partial [Nannocystis sp.]
MKTAPHIDGSAHPSSRVHLRVVEPAPEIDAAALAREIAHRVEGEVRFDAGSRALYATDASNYRHVPIGVVLPRHADNVAPPLAVCR